MIYDSNPVGLLEYLIRELEKKEILFVEIMSDDPLSKISKFQFEPKEQIENMPVFVRPFLKRTKYIANSEYGLEIIIFQILTYALGLRLDFYLIVLGKSIYLLLEVKDILIMINV